MNNIDDIFNKPYSCIRLFNKTCGEYFDEDFDGTKPSIVWADFSEANKKHSQCQDIANICSKMQKGDSYCDYWHNCGDPNWEDPRL